MYQNDAATADGEGCVGAHPCAVYPLAPFGNLRHFLTTSSSRDLRSSPSASSISTATLPLAADCITASASAATASSQTTIAKANGNANTNANASSAPASSSTTGGRPAVADGEPSREREAPLARGHLYRFLLQILDALLYLVCIDSDPHTCTRVLCMDDILN